MTATIEKIKKEWKMEEEQVEEAKPEAIDPLQQAKARAQKCSDEIQAILAKYDCAIMPMLTTEPVGTGPGTRLLVGSTYGVLPNGVE
jgi:uncharacterized protein (UPF0305 family)